MERQDHGRLRSTRNDDESPTTIIGLSCPTVAIDGAVNPSFVALSWGQVGGLGGSGQRGGGGAIFRQCRAAPLFSYSKGAHLSLRREGGRGEEGGGPPTGLALISGRGRKPRNLHKTITNTPTLAQTYYSNHA